MKVFFSAAAPAVKGYVKDTKILLQQSGERFVISRVANDLASYDSSQYSLTLRPSAFPPLVPHASTSSAPALRYHLGEPIHVKWTAPSNHSRRDWIGVYRLGANKDTLVTKVSSQGKWCGVYSKEWEGDRYEGVGGGEAPEYGEISASKRARGAIVFKGKKLPWKTGQYEFRCVNHELFRCESPRDYPRVLILLPTTGTTTTASTALLPSLSRSRSLSTVRPTMKIPNRSTRP